MTHESETSSAELPVPDDFPVIWENEEEQKLLWRWDDTHSPLPATPMTISLGEIMSEGGARARRELKQIGRGNRKRINGYSYSANGPDNSTDEEKETQCQALEDLMQVARHRWDTEFLPALKRDLGRLRQLDITSASDDKLLEYLDEFFETHVQSWYFHSFVVSPLHTAVEKMADLYREIMGDVPDEEPYLLLQGIDNMSLISDRALQALMEEARNKPLVAEIFAKASQPAMIMQELSSSDEGKEFLAKLDEFLSVYGYRPTGYDYVFPTWIEDPSFVIRNVKAYLANPPTNLAEEQRVLIAESERLLDRLLETIGDDAEKCLEFMDTYDLARSLWPLKEDHNFFIDQGSNATVRILIAEFGRRLERRGVLNGSEDVFYLTVDEMKQAMETSGESDLNALVSERREERERFIKIIPPPFLGTAPAEGEAPDGGPFGRMMGPSFTRRPGEEATALRGIVGSRGIATGRARIVRSPDEFDKIHVNDILVCTSTSPAWTPLFATIAALVSDSGGALSHTAIVAREYKLPAVVGVKYGTSMISDGQMITVDGDTGVVHLL